MRSQDIQISIIIPVYNEERRLSLALEDVFGYLKSINESAEIVLADDGSRDRTPEIIKDWQKRHPNIVYVPLGKNQGKGEAIRQGMKKARGRWRLFRDADVSTKMTQFDSFRPHLEEGADIVIGSRRVAGAKFEHRQPKLREFLGQGFTLLCRMLLVWKIRDYTCGFKCFTAEAAEAVFSRQRIKRWAFDSEILFIADRLGFGIVQTPVVWSHDEGTKVRLFRDVLCSLWEILLIRTYAMVGLYRLRAGN